MKLTAFGAVVGDKESGSFGLSVHKTVEEAVAAFEMKHGGEGDEAAGGQSCMFASVYETPFEDIDAAVGTGFVFATPAFRRSTISAPDLTLFFASFHTKLLDATADRRQVRFHPGCYVVRLV